jgi:hypothetical protein
VDAREATAALESYIATGRGGVSSIMRAPPRELDDALVARAALAMLKHYPDGFASDCGPIPPGVIRLVLDADVVHAFHLFLKAAVPLDRPDAELTASWVHAFTALRVFGTRRWGSNRQRRAKLRELAADQLIVSAIQATAAHRDDAGYDMLAVLAAEGSDASFDALVRHVERAFAEGDWQLDLLRRWMRPDAARTPALDAVFARIDEAIRVRNARSPALALGPVIGIGAVDRLAFTARLRAVEPSDTRSCTCTITIESHSKQWFHVWVQRWDGQQTLGTAFSQDASISDELGLGRCTPDELPRWLEEFTQRLAISWAVEVDFSAPPRLRPHRERILAWLRGR